MIVADDLKNILVADTSSILFFMVKLWYKK